MTGTLPKVTSIFQLTRVLQVIRCGLSVDGLTAQFDITANDNSGALIMGSKTSLQDLLKVAVPALAASKALERQIAFAFPKGVHAFLDQQAKSAKMGNMLLWPELKNFGWLVEQDRRMRELLRNAAPPPARAKMGIEPLPSPAEKPPLGFLTFRK
jgi:hypothetical protein